MNNKTKFIVLILCFLKLNFPAFGQSTLTIDSLKLRLEHSRNQEEEVKTLWACADYYSIHDFKKSLEYAEQSLVVAKSIGSALIKAKSHKKIGDVLFKAGLYERALDQFLKSKSLFQELPLHTALVGVTHNIGGVYYRMADYDQALHYFEASLSLCYEKEAENKDDFTPLLYTIYHSIGSLHGEKGQNEKAVEYFLKALTIAQEFQDHHQLGVIYNNLGKQAQILGNNQEALEYLQKALRHREKIHDLHGIAKSQLFLADYYWKIEEYDSAKRASTLALKAAQKYGGLYELSGAYSMLYQLYRQTGDDKMALRYNEKYHSYNDSIFNESSVKKITQLQMEYEYNKREKDRKAQQLRFQLIYGFVLALVILALIIVVLLYGFLKIRSRRNSLEKANLEKNLEIKDKELATNVLYLIKKNELISGISNRLLELKAKLKSENKEPLQQIIYDLTLNIDKDVWEEFEIRFQQIHSNFYDNLLIQYPDLSPSEKKMAAFLRLNMTTKDIASITGQSPRSLEVARYRLRKKLGIESRDINLVNFLCEI